MPATADAIAAGPTTNAGEYRVEGMRCAACAGRLEKALTDIPRVTGVHADHVLGRVNVTWSGAAPGTAPLKQAAEGAGFVFHGPVATEPTAQQNHERIRPNFLGYSRFWPVPWS